jgi:hypothetical protein
MYDTNLYVQFNENEPIARQFFEKMRKIARDAGELEYFVNGQRFTLQKNGIFYRFLYTESEGNKLYEIYPVDNAFTYLNVDEPINEE